LQQTNAMHVSTYAIAKVDVCVRIV